MAASRKSVLETPSSFRRRARHKGSNRFRPDRNREAADHGFGSGSDRSAAPHPGPGWAREGRAFRPGLRVAVIKSAAACRRHSVEWLGVEWTAKPGLASFARKRAPPWQAREMQRRTRTFANLMPPDISHEKTETAEASAVSARRTN